VQADSKGAACPVGAGKASLHLGEQICVEDGLLKEEKCRDDAAAAAQEVTEISGYTQRRPLIGQLPARSFAISCCIDILFVLGSRSLMRIDRLARNVYGLIRSRIYDTPTLPRRIAIMGKLTSTIGIPIKLLNEAQVCSRSDLRQDRCPY
jgi:hypothetical protein